MNKFLTALLGVAIAFFNTGCSDKGEPTPIDVDAAAADAGLTKDEYTVHDNGAVEVHAQEPKKAYEQLTINDVIQQFKADGLPIGKVQEQTAETDPNGRLGRPNEYIASAQFEDTRIEQVKPDPTIDELGLPKGGVIEIFNNDKDLQARKQHIEMAFEAMPMAKQYVYVHNNILLRLEYELTPEQAKAYETSLYKL